MSTEFNVYGKWILAGEHAVLRGGSALVFPVKSKGLLVKLGESDEPFTCSFTGENEQDYQFLFPGLVERALAQVGRDRKDLNTKIEVHSTLPIGTGLGASAALSVTVGRWFHYLGWIESSDIYEFSRSLEDLFHGESSGVDIACAIHGEGIRFRRGAEPELLELNWQPHWMLTPTGQRGLTADSVKRVQGLFDSDRSLAEQLDERMKLSVSLCEEALRDSQGISQMAEAMELASSVFANWNLITPRMTQVIEELKGNGAKAVKPTGSGGGGFILSLWDDVPPDQTTEKSLKVW